MCVPSEIAFPIHYNLTTIFAHDDLLPEKNWALKKCSNRLANVFSTKSEIKEVSKLKSSKKTNVKSMSL